MRIVVTSIAIAIALCLTPPRLVSETAHPHSDAISTLLADAKSEALELERDAMEMEAVVRSSSSPTSHRTTINLVREHVNKCGKLLARMDESRTEASKYQQEAIDQITPLLKALAATTSSTIEFVTGWEGRTRKAELLDYTTANVEAATELANLVGNFIEYEKTLEKMESLRESLKLT